MFNNHDNKKYLNRMDYEKTNTSQSGCNINNNTYI